MQQDLAKAGIVRYGFDRRLPTYAQADSPCDRRITLLGRQGGHSHARAYTLELSFAGTAAAFFAYDLYSAGAAICTSAASIRDFIAPELVAPSTESRVEASRGGQARPQNAVVEMRPSRRLLEDKAREELSEFDREYPW